MRVTAPMSAFGGRADILSPLSSQAVGSTIDITDFFMLRNSEEDGAGLVEAYIRYSDKQI